MATADPRSPRLYEEAKSAFGAQDFAAAAALCQRLLATNKRDLNGLALMAQICDRTGHPEEALGHLKQLVQLQPKNAELRVRLAELFVRQGNAPSAAAQYDKALALEPDRVEALAGKARLYERQDRYDRALRVLRKAKGAVALDPAVAAVHMRVLVHEGDVEGARDLGRRMLAAEPVAGDDLFEALFALAAAHERAGAWEEAFATARRANEVLPRRFDADEHDRLVDGIAATFTRAQLDALPRPARPSPVPLFIVGLPRCGSTLLERILHAHPRAFGAGEIGTLHVLVAHLGPRIGSPRPYPRCAADLDAGHVESLAGEYVDAIRRLAPDADRIVNKELSTYLHLGLVDVLLPAARVIHMRRRPVDTCLSCYLSPLHPSKIPYAQRLDDLARVHRAYERLMEHWRGALRSPMLEVDYEELVADQEGVTRRVLEFCGLPWDERCLRHHEVKRLDRTISYDQVRRPVYTTSVGRAERFRPWLDDLVRGLDPAAP